MAKSPHYYIRKSHRYLGVLLGIQFLLWTIGGLYFSWSNMDEVHGDLEKKHPPLLSSNVQLISPSAILDSIKAIHRIDSIVSIQLIEILGKPFYQIRCVTALKQTAASSHEHDPVHAMNHLADAVTGELREPLTKDEAVAVARQFFKGDPVVVSVEHIKNTDKHHEYREQPLPAYAVTFKHPNNTTVYVASELGTVQKFRNKPWRIFDFLWMLHTMDYESRDHIGNTLLRIFSIFGLITVLSGFVLFFVSSKLFRKNKG